MDCGQLKIEKPHGQLIPVPMEPTFPSILHLLAYNGYEDEAYIGSMTCKETWGDPRLFTPKFLNKKLGKYKETLLGILVRKGNLSRVKDLVAFGANPDIPDIFGYTPLIHALINEKKEGYMESIDYLLSLGVDANGQCCYSVPIVITDTLHIMQRLVDHGADVNYLNDSGHTPLVEKCMQHLTEIPSQLEFLCQMGANVHATDKWNRTAIEICLDSNKPLGAEVLIQYGAIIPDDAINTAIHNNFKETVLFLIKHGQKIPDDALINAIDNQLPGRVKMLLECGASPHYAQGSPLIFRAALRISVNGLAILRLLCEAGADVHATSGHASVPLINSLVIQYSSTRNEHVLQAIRYLISKGAVPRQRAITYLAPDVQMKLFEALRY